MDVRGNLYAGLSGLELQADSYEIGEGVSIHRTYAHVFAPFMAAFSQPEPGKHHPGPWKAVGGGTAFDVTAELVLPKELAERYDGQVVVAQIIVFLLRVGVNPATVMPVLSSESFSHMPSSGNEGAVLQSFEVQQRKFPLGVNGGEANEAAVGWVRDRWHLTYQLTRKSPEFALAVDALDAGQFVQNTALTLVSLWGALEALFSPSPAELRFRISSLLAAFLEPPGDIREKRQQSLAKLYDKRSSAAHGRAKHNPEDLLETFNVLRDVVIRIIDRGAVPTGAELNSYLFGSAEW